MMTCGMFLRAGLASATLRSATGFPAETIRADIAELVADPQRRQAPVSLQLGAQVDPHRVGRAHPGGNDQGRAAVGDGPHLSARGHLEFRARRHTLQRVHRRRSRRRFERLAGRAQLARVAGDHRPARQHRQQAADAGPAQQRRQRRPRRACPLSRPQIACAPPLLPALRQRLPSRFDPPSHGSPPCPALAEGPGKAFQARPAATGPRLPQAAPQNLRFVAIR
ncbi:hypothetical protein LP420_01930 [Massilia sp. B-10]|nr:hypothetical protein LP420_01930 [Massilia sp. B-10]